MDALTYTRTDPTLVGRAVTAETAGGQKTQGYLGNRWDRQTITYTWQEWVTPVRITCRETYEPPRDPGYPPGHGPHPGYEPRNDLANYVHEQSRETLLRTGRQWTTSYTRFSCSVFDPPDTLPPSRFAAGPVLFLGDELRIEQAWLKKIEGVIDYRVTLDSAPIRHRQKIDLTKLGVGYHILDMLVTVAGEGERRYHAGFSVRNKLDIRFEQPFATLPYAPGEPNGAVLDLVVTNQSSAPITGIVAIEDVPHGWQLMLIDDPVVELRPHHKKRLRAQVEIMSSLGFSEVPLPITVSIRPPLSGRKVGGLVIPGPSFGSAFVSATVPADQVPLMEARKKWANRNDGVLMVYAGHKPGR